MKTARVALRWPDRCDATETTMIFSKLMPNAFKSVVRVVAEHAFSGLEIKSIHLQRTKKAIEHRIGT